MLLEAPSVTETFGGFRPWTRAAVDLEQGEIVGLIGPNGAGKSTFFNCLAGDLRRPPADPVRWSRRDPAAAGSTRALGIGRTFQVPRRLRT